MKAYLRYELAGSWGVIATPGCNVCFDRAGKHLLTAALESVAVWNLRTATVVSAACWAVDKEGRGSRLAGGRGSGRRQARRRLHKRGSYHCAGSDA